MKKIYLFLLSVSALSLEASSQISNNNTTKNSSDDGLFTARAPYCWSCRTRHYNNCPQPSNTPVPFDGGLSILLMAGAAYGVKRVIRKKPETE